jgi:4-hydroxy-2-oxoheptanedioate aldolase
VKIARPDVPDVGGSYGVATRRFSYMGYGGGLDYVEALKDIVVAVMIEKNSAVEQLEEVLSIEGIDMVQWGPADYTMSIGKAGERGLPEIKETERRVIEMSLQAGIQPRAEINSPDDAKYYLDMGVRHFCIGTDIAVLFQWWKENGDGLRKAVEGA